MHEHTVRVTTAASTVEGFTRDGVHRWRSIPYARPPMGPLRFRAPRPAQPGRGVRYCRGFTKCATIMGVRKRDAARALLQASPAELLAAQNRLIDEGVRDMLEPFLSAR